ncbi:MAG: DMT family transporter, partial [Pseudomonadota bacterium]
MNKNGTTTGTAGTTWALVTMVFWASSFPAIKIALVSFSPLELAAVRFAIAALVLGGILLATRTAALPRSRIGRVFASAMLGVFAYQAFLNFGQQTVSAGAASFIVNTAPAITALLAIFILGEKFAARAWVGTGISFVGIAIIASAQP